MSRSSPTLNSCLAQQWKSNWMVNGLVNGPHNKPRDQKLYNWNFTVCNISIDIIQGWSTTWQAEFTSLNFYSVSGRHPSQGGWPSTLEFCIWENLQVLVRFLVFLCIQSTSSMDGRPFTLGIQISKFLELFHFNPISIKTQMNLVHSSYNHIQTSRLLHPTPIHRQLGDWSSEWEKPIH